MADLNVSRSGQIQLAGAVDALFLKLFSGEVLVNFDANCVFQDKHVVRSISQGKSAQFPAIGNISAAYHTPGTQLVGTPVAHNEKVITIDDLLLANVMIADIDEAKNHYDVRSEYSRQMGQALAVIYDKNVARVSVLNARAAAVVPGMAGGTTINGGVNVRTDGTAISNALFASAQTMDENNVPEQDRYAFMRPVTFYAAAKTTTLINKDWGGKGSIAEGKIETLAGISIVKTNHLPNTDESSAAGVPTKYRGDFSDTAILVQNRQAVGTVKLMDLSTQAEYQTLFQATAMVARMAVGHGGLRPDCGIEIAAVAP
ncbi:phage capsid protein [Paracoccus denitrificans]|uniref:phage capsid protein n=1 Tax=Paracoccus denitrificans TaxID=266 RepID=UPI001E49BCA1|nr:phage capsid protein [Paracoccus denitrificans]UFS66943.1 phage capsid protein [Paracoccus denitrificans]